ncbi:MAG: ammonium transporter [Candidatus Helarchaeota archaeon]|nr:ammonium transporter [Candidatus Helarchaeota archaeon]
MASADIAFLLICTGLVFIMTPGLALFYGGLLRKKNIISMYAMCFVSIALIGLLWFLVGYSLAFAPGLLNGFLGGFDFLALVGINTGYYPIYSTEIPHLLFIVFQMMFAIITVAIIASPFVERVKFSSFMVYIALWLLLIYAPIAHWVWGAGGWLRDLGALDFAGGTVVHVNAGFSALAIAFVIKPRRGYQKEPMEPSNIPSVLLGTGLLMLGWFGFNGGSALLANETAVLAMFNTMLAACAAGFLWLILFWAKTGKASTLALATGILAGLVAVTPAAGFVEPWAALVIGMGASAICFFALRLRSKSQIDESLDAWSVHGVGGIWGAIAVGIFASLGATGLITGNPGQILIQLIGILSTMGYSFGVSLALAWILKKTIGLRVTAEEEYLGLDITQHGERI